MTKILLVEDDKNLREIYGVRLLAEGYDIVSAGDGEEALAMAIKERPDLIVSDVMMPKISGFDMLDILRSTTETRDIKVIMMTALSSDDQRARGEQLGADRYLVKSQVGIEDVVRTVHEVLGDSATAPVAPAAQPEQSGVATVPEVSEQDAILPEPTAPFSSPRPATLGERIINPLESAEPTVSSSVASQIEQELRAPTDPVIATQVDEADQAIAAIPTPEQSSGQLATNDNPDAVVSPDTSQSV
ncbi:MAG: response regulator [Candidatus Saccharimonadales bacterium]